MLRDSNEFFSRLLGLLSDSKVDLRYLSCSPEFKYRFEFTSDVPPLRVEWESVTAIPARKSAPVVSTPVSADETLLHAIGTLLKESAALRPVLGSDPDRSFYLAFNELIKEIAKLGVRLMYLKLDNTHDVLDIELQRNQRQIRLVWERDDWAKKFLRATGSRNSLHQAVNSEKEFFATVHAFVKKEFAG